MTDTDILYEMRVKIQGTREYDKSLFILDKAAICLAFAEWTENIVQLFDSHLNSCEGIALGLLAARNTIKGKNTIPTNITKCDLISRLRLEFRNKVSSPTLHNLYSQADGYEMTALKDKLNRLDSDYIVLVMIFWKIRCHIAHSSEKTPFYIDGIELQKDDKGTLSYRIKELKDTYYSYGKFNLKNDNHYSLKGVVICICKHNERLCFTNYIAADTAKNLQKLLNEVLVKLG